MAAHAGSGAGVAVRAGNGVGLARIPRQAIPARRWNGIPGSSMRAFGPGIRVVIGAAVRARGFHAACHAAGRERRMDKCLVCMFPHHRLGALRDTERKVGEISNLCTGVESWNRASGWKIPVLVLAFPPSSGTGREDMRLIPRLTLSPGVRSCLPLPPRRFPGFLPPLLRRYS